VEHVTQFVKLVQDLLPVNVPPVKTTSSCQELNVSALHLPITTPARFLVQAVTHLAKSVQARIAINARLVRIIWSFLAPLIHANALLDITLIPVQWSVLNVMTLVQNALALLIVNVQTARRILTWFLESVCALLDVLALQENITIQLLTAVHHVIVLVQNAQALRILSVLTVLLGSHYLQAHASALQIVCVLIHNIII